MSSNLPSANSHALKPAAERAVVPHGMTAGQSYRQFLTWCARAGAIVVACVGAAVIVGWLLDIAVLKSVLPGLATMKFNPACTFLAAGVALFLLQSSVPGSRSHRLARVLAGLVLVVGGLTLLEYVFNIDLGIDQLIISDALNPSYPGRMAPAAALSFICLGFALLALKSRNPRLAAAAHSLAFPPLFVATLAIVGYAYGVSSLYQVAAYASLAVHAAFALLVISLAILAMDTEHGLTRIAVSDTAGGVVCRRLLPTVPIALFALGWVRLQGQFSWELYGTEFGTALMVLISIAILLFAIGTTAVRLDRLDVTRKRAEAEIVKLNADLERRVAERTQQLAQLAAELRAANLSLEDLSQHDELTGVANRRLFDSHLAAQIGVARRNRRALALILCDVDAFKAYNDRYGHLAGDECLKRIAEALRSCCGRPVDMVARYGGEEFAIVLPETDLAGAAKIAEAAREAVARLRIPHAASPAGVFVSISGGVGALDRKAIVTAEQLIRAADQNLYQAKALGRNQVVAAQAEAA
jgi:diguanylate cyclase (GGDEF)-like protein